MGQRWGIDPKKKPSGSYVIIFLIALIFSIQFNVFCEFGQKSKKKMFSCESSMCI